MSRELGGGFLIHDIRAYQKLRLNSVGHEDFRALLRLTLEVLDPVLMRPAHGVDRVEIQ